MTTPAIAPVHQYTYLFCDLVTDRVLAELPVIGAEYSTELNGIGTFRGTVPLSDEVAQLGPMDATIPRRTALYIDRDGVIVWAGIIWTRRPLTSANGIIWGMELQGSEFASYWQKRYVNKILSTDYNLLVANIADTRYVPDGQRMYDDQAWIVWSLLRYAEADPSGAGTIHVDTNPLVNPTGVTRTRTYDPSQQRTDILTLISQLAAVDGGFDWGIQAGWNPDGSRYRRWAVWSPRRGRPASATGFLWQYGPGGNIVTPDWPEDGMQYANRCWARGSGAGQDVVTGVAEAPDQWAAGYPLMESVETFDGVTQLNTIQAHAQASLTARTQATTAPTFTVDADADPVLGSYTVGDSAVFAIDPGAYYPAGLVRELRILSIKVSVTGGPEKVALTCGA
ncbi:unknown [Streptomyces phage mu1/6]|uniref:minor tail protein n=1 Tax=Streptomyces phage mu1/6 TaxID=370623 RepID=UPI0000D4F6DE|nr:minor tail protein [Streptomyces phage mu1/6]ABD94213.1 unknown [Streptomyces phage mu1/6]